MTPHAPCAIPFRGCSLGARAAIAASVIGILSFMASCGDSDSGPSSPVAQRPTGGQPPTIVADGTTETRQPDAAVNLKLIPVASYEVAPHESLQKFEVPGQVSVSIPGGVLDGHATLRISRVEGAKAPLLEEFAQGPTFEITLGGQKQFAQPIQIEFPFDPAVLPPDMEPRDAIDAASFDDELGQWELLPCEVRADQRVIVFHTRHLSKFSWQYWNGGRRDRSRSHLAVSWAGKEDSSEVQKISMVWHDTAQFRQRTMTFNRRYTSPKKEVAPYVYHTMRAAHSAIRQYELAGFPTQAKVLQIVVKDQLHSEHNSLTGVVTMNLSSQTLEDLQYVIGHEIFHNCQSRTFSTLGGMARRWWMEATAEWASARIAQNLYPRMGKIDLSSAAADFSRYLRDLPLDFAHLPVGWLESLNETGDAERVHAYRGSYFIDFVLQLVVHHRQARTSHPSPPKTITAAAAFKVLYDEVAKVGSGDILSAIDQYTRRELGLSFDEVYARFALWFFLHQQSPLQQPGDATIIPAAAITHQDRYGTADAASSNRTVGRGRETTLSRQFDLAAGRTSQLWVVTAARPMTLEIRTTKLPAGVLVRALVMKAGSRLAGDVHHSIHQATLEPAQDVIVVRMDPARGDRLCIVVANTVQHPRQAIVEIGESGLYWVLKEVITRDSPLFTDEFAQNGGFVGKHLKKADRALEGSQSSKGTAASGQEDKPAIDYAFTQTGSIEWDALPPIMPLGAAWNLNVTAKVSSKYEAPPLASVLSQISHMRQSARVVSFLGGDKLRGCTFDYLLLPVDVTKLRDPAYASTATELGRGRQMLLWNEETKANQSARIIFNGSSNVTEHTTFTTECLMIMLRASTPGGQAYQTYVYEYKEPAEDDVLRQIPKVLSDKRFERVRPSGSVAVVNDPVAGYTPIPSPAYSVTPPRALGKLMHAPAAPDTDSTIEFSIDVPPSSASLAYAWDFGEESFKGKPAAFTEAPRSKYRYSKPGTYEIIVTVRNKANYQQVIDKQTYRITIEAAKKVEEELIEFPKQ